jgi:hypothetical protein
VIPVELDAGRSRRFPVCVPLQQLRRRLATSDAEGLAERVSSALQEQLARVAATLYRHDSWVTMPPAAALGVCRADGGCVRATLRPPAVVPHLVQQLQATGWPPTHTAGNATAAVFAVATPADRFDRCCCVGDHETPQLPQVAAAVQHVFTQRMAAVHQQRHTQALATTAAADDVVSSCHATSLPARSTAPRAYEGRALPEAAVARCVQPATCAHVCACMSRTLQGACVVLVMAQSHLGCHAPDCCVACVCLSQERCLQSVAAVWAR